MTDCGMLMIPLTTSIAEIRISVDLGSSDAEEEHQIQLQWRQEDEACCQRRKENAVLKAVVSTAGSSGWVRGGKVWGLHETIFTQLTWCLQTIASSQPRISTIMCPCPNCWTHHLWTHLPHWQHCQGTQLWISIAITAWVTRAGWKQWYTGQWWCSSTYTSYSS